jgi:hypothetical protein
MLTNKKAQTLTYDFFIAMSIFLFILSVVMSYWYYSTVQMQEISEKNRAANNLFLASDVWFREGYPKHWNTSSIMEIGMSNEKTINKTKMNMLPQLGYSKIISLLNFAPYNLQYTVYNSSNNIIFQFPLVIGLSSARNIYKIDRFGVLDEQPVKIRTIIWD